MRPLFQIILLAITASVSAQPPEQPIKTTLCQRKEDPISFNKKLVEVSGYATHGFEDSMFEEPSCFWNNKNNLPGIWMEYGGTAGTNTMYCCGISPSNKKKPLVVQGAPVMLVRDELFEKFDKLLHSRPGKDISIRATVRARIFAQVVSIDSQHHYVGGYGHMGCCMLLAVEQVKSIDSKEPEPSIFDLATSFERKSR